jgi:diguanylate cyclase (GGDEF)-like protein
MKIKQRLRLVKMFLGYGVILLTIVLFLIHDYFSEYYIEVLGSKYTIAERYFHVIITLLTIISTLIVIRFLKVDIRKDRERKLMQDEISTKDRILQGVAEAANVLLYESDPIRGFGLALGTLGEATNVDRVYMFQNHIYPETKEFSTSQRYEWSKENIEPQIDNPDLQNVGYEEFGIMRWYNILSKGGVVSGLVKDFPKSEKEILCPQGILSLLVVPVVIDEEFWGFIGFDDCQSERVWTRVEESTLLVAAASIGAAIKKQAVEKALQEALQNDFKRTVKSLPNLVFKFEKNKKGKFIYTFFEGKLAERFGENTESMYGKGAGDVLPEEAAGIVEEHLYKADRGITCSYEIKTKNGIFYHTLSPIIEDGKVIEIVGSSIDMTDYKKAQEQVKFLAYYDSLTGLPNRVLFNDRLDLAISHSKRNNQMLSIMFIDLDRFKDINDTMGHTTGDLLLKEVAERLKNAVRDDDTVARMGGDEFALIFTDIDQENHIVRIAENIMSVFTSAFVVNGHEFYITPSAGISIYPNDGQQTELLLKNADMAMYRAKEFGKNNYQFFTSSMNEKAIKRLEMERSLRKALEREEFILYYQPQVDISTGKIVGCEALIRWNNPELGLVSPGEFIPLAEETGLIIPMGEWVLREACNQLKKLHQGGYEGLRMSVNISAKQFEQQDLPGIINDVLLETGIESKYLELEITESTIMKSTDRTTGILERLKGMGIRISIDDFGTGFSSLGYLQRFSADILKIDQSFIRNIPLSSNDEAIVTAIINMAHVLSLNVIAEGVETEEQLTFLKKVKCNEIQGYYISRPLPKAEFMKLLKASCFYS